MKSILNYGIFVANSEQKQHFIEGEQQMMGRVVRDNGILIPYEVLYSKKPTVSIVEKHKMSNGLYYDQLTIIAPPWMHERMKGGSNDSMNSGMNVYQRGEIPRLYDDQEICIDCKKETEQVCVLAISPIVDTVRFADYLEKMLNMWRTNNHLTEYIPPPHEIIYAHAPRIWQQKFSDHERQEVYDSIIITGSKKFIELIIPELNNIEKDLGPLTVLNATQLKIKIANPLCDVFQVIVHLQEQFQIFSKGAGSKTVEIGQYASSQEREVRITDNRDNMVSVDPDESLLLDEVTTGAILDVFTNGEYIETENNKCEDVMNI